MILDIINIINYENVLETEIFIFLSLSEIIIHEKFEIEI